MTNTENIRKCITILNSNVKKTKTTLKEHGFGSMDNIIPDETKVEVVFKGDNHIDVNVHAETTDDLKRLMDLAGIYHNESHNDISEIPVNNPLDNRPENDLLAVGPVDSYQENPLPVSIEDTSNTDINNTELSMPMDDVPLGKEEVDAGILGTVAGGIAGAMLGGPMGALTGAAAGHELTDDIEEDTIPRTADMAAGATNEFGHPNPLAGKQKFSLTANSFSGHGSKEVRYVPARSGDNAMDDTHDPRSSAIRVKGLKEYINEITDSILEQKTPDDIIAAAKAQIATPLTTITQQNIDKATANIANKPGTLNLKNKEIIDSVTSNLDPKSATQLEKGYADAVTSGELEEHNLNWGDYFDNDRECSSVDDDAYNCRREYKDCAREVEMGKLGNLDDEYFNEFDDDLDEARYKHTYSFRTSVVPFQKLSGKEQVRRRALKTVKRNRK